MLTIRNILAKNYVNFRGWNTKRHIVVIESDDWGSIRMPSKSAYERMLSKGVNVDKNYFDKNDSLESAEDLQFLFEVLHSVKDKNGHGAVITPLTIVANPDFDKIEKCGKTQYYYESFVDTYTRNNHTEETLNLFKEGISEGIFYPQYHGREHVNVQRWLAAINSNSQKEKIAFDERALIASPMNGDKYTLLKRYTPAFDYDCDTEKELEKGYFAEGVDIFKQVFGFTPVSFCAPCGIMSDDLNNTAKECGIDFIQNGQQFIPLGEGNIKVINRFWGQQNQFGQIYWRRNCTFEPAKNHNYDWVDQCLSEIAIAFRWGKPANINSHRVNYIGSINPENRTHTLIELKRLLKEIVNKWPDVEFVSSEELGRIISSSL